MKELAERYQENPELVEEVHRNKKQRTASNNKRRNTAPSYDLWANNGEAPKELTYFEKKRLKVIDQLLPKVKHAALEPALPGQSYNPTFDDHQDLIAQEVAREQKKIDEAQVLNSAMASFINWKEHHASSSSSAAVDSATGLTLQEDDDDDDDEEEEEEEGAAAAGDDEDSGDGPEDLGSAPQAERKTKADRRRKANRREHEGLDEQARVAKKQRKDINNILQIEKDLSQEGEEREVCLLCLSATDGLGCNGKFAGAETAGCPACAGQGGRTPAHQQAQVRGGSGGLPPQ